MKGRDKNNYNSRLSKRQDIIRKKVASKKGPCKIALVMIVKNESKNMVRLLDSVKKIIDMASIVDTGSTDNTEEVITKWGIANKVPITIHHEAFLDFSHNRTHSVKVAKETYPEADYFLLSDADFIWEINTNGVFDKCNLTDHKYLVEQYTDTLSYWNVRMLSSKINFSCVGVTHEYWREDDKQDNYLGSIRTCYLNTLRINDIEDGGCKTNKFTRDLELLLRDINKPTTPDYLKCRYKFYLGQTLKDMGRNHEAIEWYLKRVEDKGWTEEVFYSLFQIGYNYEQIGWKKKHVIKLMASKELKEEEKKYIETHNPNNLSEDKLLKEADDAFADATTYYLKAYEYNSSRSESLYYLTRMNRLLGRYDIALEYAKIGSVIKFPSNGTLFIEKCCYSYLFDFELSIIAYYCPKERILGKKALERLSKCPDLPKNIADVVENNKKFYDM